MVESILLGIGCLLLISLIFIIKNNYKRIYLIFESIKDSYRELDRKTENINSKIIEEEEKLNIISDEIKDISKKLKSGLEQNNKPMDKVLDEDVTKDDDDISTNLKPGERLLFTKELKLNFHNKFIQLDPQGNEVKYSSGNNTKEIPKEIIEKLNGKTVNKKVELENQAKESKSTDDSKVRKKDDKEAINIIKEVKKRDEISINKRRSIKKRRKKYKVVIKENNK